jgi:chromosome segregation ATPase
LPQAAKAAKIAAGHTKVALDELTKALASQVADKTAQQACYEATIQNLEEELKEDRARCAASHAAQLQALHQELDRTKQVGGHVAAAELQVHIHMWCSIRYAVQRLG